MCILCGYIHVHVHVYCDVVYSTYIGTCSYVIVSYLIMSDNINSSYNDTSSLIMNTKNSMTYYKT